MLQSVPDTAETSSPASGLLLSFTSDHTCALGPNRRVPSSTGNVTGLAVLPPDRHQVARVELPRGRGAGRVARQALPVQHRARGRVHDRQVELLRARPRERLPREPRAAARREQDERRPVGVLRGGDASAAVGACRADRGGRADARHRGGDADAVHRRPGHVDQTAVGGDVRAEAVVEHLDAALRLRPREVVHARDVHVVLPQAERLDVGVRQAERRAVRADEAHGDGPGGPRAARGEEAVKTADHPERARHRIGLHHALRAQPARERKPGVRDPGVGRDRGASAGADVERPAAAVRRARGRARRVRRSERGR